MSTKFHDFATQSVVRVAIPPASYDEATTGDPIDLVAADGRAFAAVLVGTIAGGGTVVAAVEQSADLTAWTAVPGAATPTVNAAGAYTVGFDRTARYVRVALTITGEVALAVCVGQQQKIT